MSKHTEMERFFALARAHAWLLSKGGAKRDRVPHGTFHCGVLFMTAEGELVLTDGTPASLDDDHPLAHNCDEMGCTTFNHVIARHSARAEGGSSEQERYVIDGTETAMESIDLYMETYRYVTAVSCCCGRVWWIRPSHPKSDVPDAIRSHHAECEQAKVKP